MEDFPGFRIEKIGFLSNRALARQAGVKSIPTLVCGEKRLSGMLLTKKGIRNYLESL